MSIAAQLALCAWYAVCLGTPVAVNYRLTKPKAIPEPSDIDRQREGN